MSRTYTDEEASRLDSVLEYARRNTRMPTPTFVNTSLNPAAQLTEADEVVKRAEQYRTFHRDLAIMLPHAQALEQNGMRFYVGVSTTEGRPPDIVAGDKTYQVGTIDQDGALDDPTIRWTDVLKNPVVPFYVDDPINLREAAKRLSKPYGDSLSLNLGTHPSEPDTRRTLS